MPSATNEARCSVPLLHEVSGVPTATTRVRRMAKAAVRAHENGRRMIWCARLLSRIRWGRFDVSRWCRQRVLQARCSSTHCTLGAIIESRSYPVER